MLTPNYRAAPNSPTVICGHAQPAPGLARLVCVLELLVELLVELLHAAAVRASTTAVPPRPNLRILFRPVEPYLMAFTHSKSRHLAEST